MYIVKVLFTIISATTTKALCKIGKFS